MPRYGVVLSGNVIGVALWDGTSPWTPPGGGTAVLDSVGNAEIGGTYVAPNFFPPVPGSAPPIDPPIVEIPIGQLYQYISTASGTLNIDLSLGWRVSLTLNHTITDLTFTNIPPSGELCVVYLEIYNTGAFDITGWPLAMKWIDGLQPVITQGASKLDMVMLETDVAGASWRGYREAPNMKIGGPVSVTLLASATETQLANDTITSASITPQQGALLVAFVSSVGPNVSGAQLVFDSLGDAGWTERTNRIQSNGRSSHMTIYTRPVPASAALTVSAITGDGTSSASFLSLAVFEIMGHKVSAPVRATFTDGADAGRSGAYSQNLAAAPLTSSLVIAACCADMSSWTGTTFNIGSGWTQRQEHGQVNGGTLLQTRANSVSQAIAFATLGATFSWIVGAIEIQMAGT